MRRILSAIIAIVLILYALPALAQQPSVAEMVLNRYLWRTQDMSDLDGLAALPVFLALSTSSPFWNRAATGLLSYRQAAYDEWPRTGIPDHFENEAEYARFVELLVGGGAVPDSSYLWWAIRPAARYPTLELRICDTCTRLADSIAIASLYRCLVRLLVRRPELAPPWTPFTRRLIDENRWRAKRFGIDAEFIALDGGKPVRCRDAVAQLVSAVEEDAEALRCTKRLGRVRALMAEGTSAHLQLAIYRGRRARGDAPLEALRYVVDWLVAATITEPEARLDAKPEAAKAGVSSVGDDSVVFYRFKEKVIAVPKQS